MILFEKVSHRWIKNLHGLMHDIIKERQKLTNKTAKQSHGKDQMNPVRLAILNLFDDFLLKSLMHSDKKNATKRLLGQTRLEFLGLYYQIQLKQALVPVKDSA
jgi:hypothetical protein